MCYMLAYNSLLQYHPITIVYVTILAFTTLCNNTLLHHSVKILAYTSPLQHYYNHVTIFYYRTMLRLPVIFRLCYNTLLRGYSITTI